MQHISTTALVTLKPILAQKSRLTQYNTLGKPNAWSILTLTKCPKSIWIENYYKTKLSRGNKDQFFLGINIGCNKGYDAVKIAWMGTGNSKFDTDDWAKSMTSSGVDSAGACNQMISSKLLLDSEEEYSSRILHQGEVHCVEPLPSTVSALRNSSGVLGLKDEGLVITQAAISSSYGSAYFPNKPPGSEQGTLASCDVSKNSYVEVPMYSLETYVETYVEDQCPINILSIDVEGYGFDVLFGAGSSIIDRVIGVLIT